MPHFIRHTAPFLVNSSEVVFIRDSAHALEVLREFDRGFPPTDARRLEQLATDLAHRRVFLIRPQGRIPLDPPKYVSITTQTQAEEGPAESSELIRRDDLGEPQVVRTFFGLRILGDHGEPLTGIEARVDLPGRASMVLRSDDGGNILIDDVAKDGMASVELPKLIELPPWTGGTTPPPNHVSVSAEGQERLELTGLRKNLWVKKDSNFVLAGEVR